MFLERKYLEIKMHAFLKGGKLKEKAKDEGSFLQLSASGTRPDGKPCLAFRVPRVLLGSYI